MRSKHPFILLIIINLLGSPSKLFSQTNLLMDINLSDDSLVIPSIIHNVNSNLIIGSDIFVYQNSFLSYQNSALVKINQGSNSIDTAVSLYTPSALKEITEFKTFSIINHSNNLVSIHRKFYQGRNPDNPTISVLINYYDSNLTSITSDTIELINNVKNLNLNRYKIRLVNTDSLFIYTIVYDSTDGNPQTRFINYNYNSRTIFKNRLYTDNYLFGLDASTISLNSSNTLFSFASDNNDFGNVTLLSTENLDIVQRTFIRNKTIFNSPLTDNIVYCLDNVKFDGFDYLLNLTESTSFDENNRLRLTSKLNLKKIDSNGVVVNAKWFDCNVPSNIDYSPFYRNDLRFITTIGGRIYFVYDPDVGNSFYIASIDTALNIIWWKEYFSTSSQVYHVWDVSAVGNYLYFSGGITDANNKWKTFLFKINETGTFTGVSENQIVSKSYTIFPNPTNDFIILPKGSTNLQIFDLIGKQYHCPNNADSFDLSELKSGIYFVKFTLSGEQQIQRIIKQ